MPYSVGQYIIDPPHPISILLVGVGGNGSLLATLIARMHLSLLALGHQGISLRVIDDDIVSESNVGRQAFSVHDIGQSKARIVTERINMFYGTKFEYRHAKNKGIDDHTQNIIITCTDNVKSRLDIHNGLVEHKKRANEMIKINSSYWKRIDERTFLYWIDIGNSKNKGQIVLSDRERMLKTVVELFGKENYKKSNSTREPSCSLAGALQHQDLCINTMMATFTQKLLWDMFTKGILDYHGFVINLEDLTFNKLPV